MGFRTFLLVLATLFLRLAVSETPEEFVLRHQQARTDDGRAPLYGTEQDSRFIDEYIVMFQEGYTLQQHFESIGMDLSDTTRFKSFSYGYGAKLDNITLHSVRLDPGVLRVETDGPVELIRPFKSNTCGSADAKMQKRYTIDIVESQAPYGLQMLSSRERLLSPVYDEGEYHFQDGAGRGVNVYVFDTGQRATIFQGGLPGDKSKYTAESNDDRDGHGTHVAGTIGAEKYGVAPFANLISVKVIGRGGSMSLIAQAIADVTAEHRANEETDHSGSPWEFRGSIINMSMGSTYKSECTRKHLIDATRAGITVFAAAGNDQQDAGRKGHYPCSYPETVCVGAVNNNYAFEKTYSNYGSVVDFLAPGSDVLSLGIRHDKDLTYLSGTSQACPHAAGAAAIFVSWQGLINNQAPQYLKVNAVDKVVYGVPPGTGTRLINTGIRLREKDWNGPFRESGQYPVGNHNQHLFDIEAKVLDTITDLSSVASGTPLAGIDIASYTTMKTITLSAATGLTTETGTRTWDPTMPGPTSSNSLPTNTVTPMPPAGGVLGQQIALISNMNPDADMDDWKRLIGYDSNKVSVLIANIQNGDFGSVNNNWEQVISAANSSGKRIIGYVDTGYLGSSEEMFTTRLGSNDPAEWMSQIESDVDTWYRLYGDEGGLGGIFFDRGWSDCGPDNTYSDLYAYINIYTKRRYPGAFTVLNTASGSKTSQCLENTMDTLLTFIGSYDTYMSSYDAPDWTPADPRKIWHVIHDVPADEVSTVIALAGQRGAGLVEVNDAPYDTLPDDAYMQSFINAVQGGSAPVADAPDAAVGPAVNAPESLEITSNGYCSVSLSWNSSVDAVGYNLYLDGTQVLSLPSYMTSVTVGDIPPGSSNLSIFVRAIGGGNTESYRSEPVIASTLALPGGRSIINLQADPQDGFTTYTADVLVPYSSLAVFISYSSPSGTCDFQNVPAWPIYYNSTSCYCAVAALQDEKLYRYSGTITDPSDVPFTWTQVGSVVITRKGYSYSWVAPIGLSTMDTTSFIIQAQGHGPTASFFSPCPEAEERPEEGIFCA